MPEGAFKIGITAPKRCGKAVRRNRIKRIIRETYRLNKERFPAYGSLLFLIIRTDDETSLKQEMFQLTDQLLHRAEE